MSGSAIHEIAQAAFDENVVVRTDGWIAYRVLDNEKSKHEPVVVGSGKNAVRLLPWVHSLIAPISRPIFVAFTMVSEETSPELSG